MSLSVANDRWLETMLRSPEMIAGVGQTLGIVLMAAVAAGAILVISWFSVARIVWLHKHPEWPYEAAFNHVYWHGLVGLAMTAAMIGAIWLIPKYIRIPLPENDLNAYQVLATACVVVVSNLTYYWITVEKIRRPPK